MPCLPAAAVRWKGNSLNGHPFLWAGCIQPYTHHTDACGLPTPARRRRSCCECCAAGYACASYHSVPMHKCADISSSRSVFGDCRARTSHMSSRSLVLLVLVLAAACPALTRRTHTPSVTKNELTTAQVGRASARRFHHHSVCSALCLPPTMRAV